MLQKIIHFIKYHNAFTIILALVFIISASAFASQEVRNTIIGEKIETKQGIDNSLLLAVDLDNFDLSLQIQNVLEDDENYYIDYTFNTIAIKDNIWQLVIREKRANVSKRALGDRDLGLHLQEELSEVVDYELAYLKEVQANEKEKEKGRTQITKTTDYTGLIGLVLDVKNKILPGYEPVVKPPEPVPVVYTEPVLQPEPQPEPVITTPEIGKPPAQDVCDSTHLNLCTTQELCKRASLYWYNGTCNLKPENIPDTTPPIITLLGDATVNINVGDTYIDVGATASDDVDGDITAQIVVVNPVNAIQEGTYVITYNVSDTAGNAAPEVIRTVKVVAPPGL